MREPKKPARWWVVFAVAAWGLAGCGGDESDPARLDRYRREGNAEALGEEGRKPGSPMAPAAVRALGDLGPRARPYLEEAMKDPRTEVRESAVWALSRVVPEGDTATLAEAARSDPSSEVRAVAVTALGQVRAIDEMNTLLSALEDPDRLVRLRASVAVARILGRRYETCVDGTPEERRNAVARVRREWPALEAGVRDYYNKERRREESR